MLLFLVIYRLWGSIWMDPPSPRQLSVHEWPVESTYEWEDMGHETQFPVFTELGFERRMS